MDLFEKRRKVGVIIRIFVPCMSTKKSKQSFKNNHFRESILPDKLPVPQGRRLIMVMVEGYEDVAFWRGIFDEFESEKITFEVTVPTSDDLAKGKMTLLRQAHSCDDCFIMCMDSDFDYLFADQTAQAKLINSSPYLFHTYTYATENYLCYAPSLHNVCVKATKNDARIFDFEQFFAAYSRTIFPLFVWYAYSAQTSTPKIFPLAKFRNAVRLGYLDSSNNGAGTITWLSRQVQRLVDTLEKDNPQIVPQLTEFKKLLYNRGVTKENVYLFMHGHTLMNNVVIVALDTICTKLRLMATDRIKNAIMGSVALINEQSNYNNSLYRVRDALLFNENYKECFLYKKLRTDIEKFISTLE